MKRVLSAVLTGCASTAAMWLVLSQVEQLDPSWRPPIAGLIGVVALIAAALLLPKATVRTSVGSDNRFRRTGRVEVEDVSVNEPADSVVKVGTNNKMRDGEVVVRRVDIGKDSESDA